jgi:phage recombination protein Bet
MTKKIKEVEKEDTVVQVIEAESEVKEIEQIGSIIESKELSVADTFGKLSRPQIDLIKKTVAKGASDDELKLFIQVCKGANLNPFLKQVFLVPRWNSQTGKEDRAIQVSIDGLRAIAEEGGAYAGNEDPIFEGEDEVTVESKSSTKKLKHPHTAKVTVYKIVQGGRYEFSATARWAEYYPGAKMGFQWHIRPYLMLGKCAEALALRKAFPKLLSGMYAQEELDRSTGEERPQVSMGDLEKKIASRVATMSQDEINDFKPKMAGSDKYTAKQKIEFFKLVEKREGELSVNSV